MKEFKLHAAMLSGSLVLIFFSDFAEDDEAAKIFEKKAHGTLRCLLMMSHEELSSQQQDYHRGRAEKKGGRLWLFNEVVPVTLSEMVFASVTFFLNAVFSSQSRSLLAI
ncbi:hypothetical protein OUZ56_001747 [Daphnia magna]|uniref:Uncharacterized protein n=1 Tax=Daphnia magna TaxID=35525 RepID=A0ABR0A427_9CRUS|nr:hypothetical protein OUZ56_001747 [Daphnia magna]